MQTLTAEDLSSSVSPRHDRNWLTADDALDKAVSVDGWMLRTRCVVERYVLYQGKPHHSVSDKTVRRYDTIR